MAHPPELKQRAKELRKQGLLIKVIAADLDVPKTTVTRWLNPELEKRERARARNLKFSKKRMCPRCKTRRLANNSALCQRCERETRRKWTAERVVQAIQDWAIEHGYPPAYQDWQRSGDGHPALRSITDGPRPVFRSWSEALLAAGFKPYARRRRRGRRPLTEQEKQERAVLRRKLRENEIRKALEKENT